MRRVAAVLPFLALVWLPAAGSAYADAVVLVAEDGGLDPPSVRTVRTIASNELRARGVKVTEDPRFHATLPLTTEVLETVSSLGVDRLFVLRLGRLGEKVMFSMEEVRPPEATPQFVASLTGESIEEADTVVPRLVRSVLERAPVEKTASIATVTADESKTVRKKPGEGFWFVGVAMAPLGGSLGWGHEARNWRLGALIQNADEDPSFIGFEGAWIPNEGNVSPYLGGGIGVMDPPDDGGDSAKPGAKLDLGVEFFRLHAVRLLVGGTALIPFGSMERVDSVSPEFWIRLGL